VAERFALVEMDKPPLNVEPSEEASKSWETRYQEFEEDESSTLGQHNLDDTSTRTKITHIEGLGFGVIGSVLSLAYGCWLNQPAALLVMQFSFRAKERSRRYKNAEISVCFESGAASSGGPPNTVSPVVRSWYPKNNRTTKPLTNRFGGNPSHTPPPASTHTLNSSQSTGQSVWPAEEFWIRGRTWSRKNREEPHVVLWSMTEAESSATGISEQIRLAVIVTFSGHFRAVVDIKATLGFGLKLRNFPWSRDDPILFDGNTPKGKSPPTSDFNAITDQELLDYVSDPNISSLNTSLTPNESTSDQNKRSEQSTAAAKTYPASRRVYRVRGLLPFWSLAISVKILSASIKVREDSVRVHSFAENPYRAEKMAIISLEDSHNGALILNTKMEWLVQAQLSNEEATTEIMDGKPIQLLFDSHFYGFSELGLLSIDSSACIAE
jgi:protein SERAC1